MTAVRTSEEQTILAALLQDPEMLCSSRSDTSKIWRRRLW